MKYKEWQIEIDDSGGNVTITAKKPTSDGQDVIGPIIIPNPVIELSNMTAWELAINLIDQKIKNMPKLRGRVPGL